MENPAYEDSVQLLVRLLRSALGEDYNYFDGDPDLLAKHELPAVIVEQVSDATEAGSFGQDDVTDVCLVKIVYDKSDDWSDQRENLNMTHRRVREAMNGRDETGKYRDNTLKGALRPEVYGERRIGGNISVDYGFLSRPENVFTSEGHATVSVLYSVDIDLESN